jgi:acyl carrier protein
MSWISRIFGEKPERPERHQDAEPRHDGASGGVSSADHGEILASLTGYLAVVAEKNGRMLGTADLQADVDLYEAGYLDSVSSTEFLLLTEKEYGVQLPDWLIGGPANTLDKLARHIEAQLNTDETRG